MLRTMKLRRQIATLVVCAALSSAILAAQPNPIVPPDKVVTSYTLPPDKLAKATSLYTVRVRLLVVGTVFGFVMLMAFLYLRVGPRVRNWAERIIRGKGKQGFIYVPVVLLLLFLFQLPLDLYGHKLSVEYGLSVQGWASWLGDWGKGLFLQLLLGTGAITGVYTLMRRSPRRWWLWSWVISIPFVVFIIFISPYVIDPMFNHFDPLEPRQPQLVSELEKVVRHGGMTIPRDRMFEMRASEKVTTLNAYVTGLGASKRVVVWDNTIQKMTVPQILYVFGHEMGHYVLDHVWKGLAFFLGLLFVAYYVGARLGHWAVRRFGVRWDIRGLDDWASLPLLILIVSLVSFVTTPMSSGISRYLEHQADQYGMEVIHGIVGNPNQVAAQTFQALGENGLEYPYPNGALVWWLYDHPPSADRLQFVLSYKPWDEGKSGEFVK
jgi:Zn-dependent protease with chaperone function